MEAKQLNNEKEKSYYQETATEMIDLLERKGYDAHYAEDLEDAKKIVLDMIPENSVIGLGGSITVGETGLLEEFRSEKYKLIDRYNQPSKNAMFETYRQALHSDYFISGTNAITRNGELVNVDCSGNRVSAMIYGPKRVIIVAGANKVVDTLDDAFKRIEEIAPMNCKRFNSSAPCVETGICEDCDDKGRMCNYTTIIHNGRKFEGRISIVIIADALGY